MKRRLSDQDAQSRSDASSNGFDTESDVGHSGASSAQNTRRVREKMLNHSASPSVPQHPPPQPVKKKRTRTLTTPQQSAALHALLAQSRFPTTAMREQVGRSIGLSARKVQVWFQASISLGSAPAGTNVADANSQNQRQKARRPRDSKNQGSPTAPARPPQYGAFPNVSAVPFLPSSASSTVHPTSLPSDELYATTHSASAPFVNFNANRGQQESATSSGRLSGPGVPGAASSSSSSFTAPHFSHTPQRQPPPQMQTLAPLADPSPKARSSLTRDVHSTSSARQMMPSRDFTFNHPFPPLHLQVPETSGVFGAGQNQYPTMIPLRPLTASSHHSLAPSSNASSGKPRSQHTSSSSSSSPRSPPSPFAPASASVSLSRPQTPVSSFLVPRHRDLPRLRIVPLHVPESPHTNTHANNTHAHASVHVHVHVQQQSQRSAPQRYSPPPLSLLPDPTRFSRSDRALPSLFHSTSSTSRGDEISPVPAHASVSASASIPASSSASRARRFDPVREAASECSRSGSLGTDSSMSTGTPPRIDTPKRLTTSS